MRRRTILRGLGSAVALPTLDAFASPEAPPMRMAFLYAPNGRIMDSWRPREPDER